jgi:hypothetical protein
MNQGKARKFVRDRSDGRCEARLLGICLGRAMSFHHRLRRSQGGLWTPSNGLDVCGDGTRGCHGALTNTNGRYDEFHKMGLILRSGQDPLLVGAEIFSVQYWAAEVRVRLLLQDDGDVVLAGFPESAPGDPFTMPVPAVDWPGRGVA